MMDPPKSLSLAAWLKSHKNAIGAIMVVIVACSANANRPAV